ncbi:hypothetical protein WMY93_011996 [Mugilogobius chulae]|uniref:Uncharacterized protein n=1 Tax=Mugilogobius chulae TaxID=88201 RepID=A0AAW0P493_9GOBI
MMVKFGRTVNPPTDTSIMSASLVRSECEGVTVLTLTSDPSSACPPFSPVPSPQRLPGGAGSSVDHERSNADRPGHNPPHHQGRRVIPAAGHLLPVWLGVLFIGIGVCTVLTEKFPRPCVLLFSGILNLFGVAMSITAIVWYSSQFTYFSTISHFYSMCYDEYDYWSSSSITTTTVSPQQKVLQERCLEAKRLLRVLVYSISAVLVTLSVLGLCLGISSATLSFKALKPAKTTNKDQHCSEPLLQDKK